MTAHSHDQMHRPLFADAGPEAERLDEWSWPKGIMFGGMAALGESDLETYADQYFNAAEAVIGLVLRNDVADYTVQNPIIYLYRHALELYLKAILSKQAVGYGNEHSLHKLMNKASFIEDWARKRLQEINDIDPSSQALRYGGDKKRFADGEEWAEITHFRDSMRCLRDHLVQVLKGARASP